MDANGTRFHLLLGKGDWRRCLDEGGRSLAFDEHGRAAAPVGYDVAHDELILAPEPFVFRSRPGAPVLDPAARRGAARDRYGTWYRIDGVPTSVSAGPAGAGATTRFWSVADAATGCTPATGPFAPLPGAAPDPPPATLAGAAVTEDHYLVVGYLPAGPAPGGLLVFDLQAGGPPDRLRWPPGVAFRPYDLAARAGGGVHVLDRANRRLWELDRHFTVVTPRVPGVAPPRAFAPLDPQPAAGVPAPQVPDPLGPPTDADAIALDDAGPLDLLAVEAAPGGIVLVLLRDAGAPSSAVRVYRERTLIGPVVPQVTVDGATVTLAPYDMALVPAADDRSLGTLFLVDARGDQSFAFDLALGDAGPTLVSLARYHPMRLFGGRALVAAGGQAWYDMGDDVLPLVAQPRQRYATTGTVLTDVLDGGEPGCVWHRLLLDALLPPDTSVAVSGVAADDRSALDPVTALDWLAEPAPYPRGDGPELPYLATGAYRTWELAFQRARGRYLRLRLVLTGNKLSTPRIRALRAYFPRFSYLERYLPAVYREDEGSASFLDRFLANVEGIATTIEDRIAAAQMLLDPRTVPAEALDWLGSWLALVMDPAWDQRTRRLLLTHAVEFYRWRGTVRGVRTALALALPGHRVEPDLFGEQPDEAALPARVVEMYRTKTTPGVTLGDPTEAAVTPAPGARWQPADGAVALHERYRTALADAGARFPVRPPDEPLRRFWTDFARSTLGFVPSAADVDLPAWQDFLARRYPRPADLRAVYPLAGGTGQPEELPDREPALTDWFRFQAVVLPALRTAHRFRVLLPVPVGTGGDGRNPQAALARTGLVDLARRVVELAKPAHTTFDVRFFWDAFRVGQARLGLDTVADLGSRAPDLLADAVLGRAYLGESVLVSRTAATAASRCPPPVPLADRRCP